MKQQVFIGINKEGDLVSVELNFNDLNKGTEFYDPHFYLTPHGYSDIKDEETGEQEARETLEDSCYWDDIYGSNTNDPRLRNVDYEQLAEEVINSDGWQNTNGEYYEIGFYKDKTYYISLQWIGYADKSFNKSEYKKIFISKEDFNFLASNRNVKESDENKVTALKTIFSKEQDKHKIIKAFLEEKENQ